MANIKRAKVAFGYMVGHVPRVVKQGDLYYEDDPIVEQFSRHFEDVEVQASSQRERRKAVYQPQGVEQATSDPGEKRTRTAPRRRKRKDEEESEPTPETNPDASDSA